MTAIPAPQMPIPSETDDGATRSLKLRLPVGHIVRLQGHRLVRRMSMSDVLAEALTQYFQTTARPWLAGLAQKEADS